MNSTNIIRSASVQGVRRIGSKQANEERIAVREKQPKKKENTKADVSIDEVLDEQVKDTVAEKIESEKSAYTKEMFDALQQQLNESNRALELLKEDLISANQQLEQYHADLEKSKQVSIEDGYKHGIEQAKQEFESKKIELDAAIEAFGRKLDFEQSGVNQLAVEVAFGALEKILGVEYKNQDFVQSVVANAAQSLRQSGGVKIHLNESDYQLLNAHREQLAKELGHDCELISDIRVAAGGCILEAGAGSFDARMESQLQIIKDALVNAMEERQS